MSLGPAEILVILVIALLVFGPNRLPEIGRQVGRGVREFRKFQDSIKGDLGDVFGEDASDHSEPAPSLPPRELEAAVDPGAHPGPDPQSPDPQVPDPQVPDPQVPDPQVPDPLTPGASATEPTATPTPDATAPDAATPPESSTPAPPAPPPA